MTVDEKKEPPFTLAMIAGACAGTTVDVALHPLDTLRTRLQASEGFWNSGGFKGCYRGILSATLGSSPGAAAFFGTYETMKQVIKKASNGNHHWTHDSAASSCGEVAACLVRVPTAVVTQNMQVGRYNSMTEAVTTVMQKEGFLGFYKGYGTTVMREIPFSFIQFPIYEGLKKVWSKAQGRQTDPNQGALCGSVAGSIASALTTPLDVAKTRIMIEKVPEGGERVYSGTVQTLTHIYKNEGFPALWKGIGPRVGWITAGGFIFFGAYEWAQKLLWSTKVWN